jgi:uncharacterized repeat protein (TIGR01451 family)
MQIPSVVSSNIPAADLPFMIEAAFTGAHSRTSATTVVQEFINVLFSKPLDVKVHASPVPISPGGELEYVVSFANSGTTTATNVSVELELPNGVNVLSAQGGDVVGSSILWQIGQMGFGLGDQYRVVVADGLGSDGQVLAAEAYLWGSTGKARTRTVGTTRTVAPLTVAASTNLNPLQPGNNFNYRLTVTNTSLTPDALLESVLVDFIVPTHTSVDGRTIIGASSSCTSSSCSTGSEITLTLGTLMPGESREITIPTTVVSGTPQGSLIDIRFQGFASFPNGDHVQQVVEPLTLLVGEFATAIPNTYPLSVNRMGVGGNGTVTSNPGGINCGNVCQAEFTEGTSVTLTAQPASGSSFSGWNGACSGTGSCTVTMDQARSVTARLLVSTMNPPPTPMLQPLWAVWRKVLQVQASSSTPTLRRYSPVF